MPKQVKQNRNQSGLRVGAFAFWGGLVLFGAVFAYVRMTPNALRVPQEESRNQAAPPSKPAVTTTSETSKPAGKVNVSTPYYEGDDLKFDHHKADVPAGKSDYLTAINGFLKASKIVGDDALARTAILDGSTLVLDFSSGFDRTYGAEDERTLINGLLDTIKQFKGVNAVRILVSGKRIETLGNVDLTEDLTLP